MLTIFNAITITTLIIIPKFIPTLPTLLIWILISLSLTLTLTLTLSLLLTLSGEEMVDDLALPLSEDVDLTSEVGGILDDDGFSSTNIRTFSS